MKATLKKAGSSFVLTLTPESPVEVGDVKAFVASRNTHIFHRGYQYMVENVEFIINEPSTGRDF